MAGVDGRGVRLAHARTGVEAHALIRAHRRSRYVREGGASWRLDLVSGWLEGVRRVPSPNCDERPPETDIDLVVVHGISLPPRVYGGEYIDRLFTNTLDPAAHPDFRPVAGLRVSAHVLIGRDGGLTQYVPLHLRAWHAGASRFEDRSGCNDFSSERSRHIGRASGPSGWSDIAISPRDARPTRGRRSSGGG
jgi:N-acetylmuramoyl-L-alanine amidase